MKIQCLVAPLHEFGGYEVATHGGTLKKDALILLSLIKQGTKNIAALGFQHVMIRGMEKDLTAMSYEVFLVPSHEKPTLADYYFKRF